MLCSLLYVSGGEAESRADAAGVADIEFVPWLYRCTCCVEREQVKVASLQRGISVATHTSSLPPLDQPTWRTWSCSAVDVAEYGCKWCCQVKPLVDLELRPCTEADCVKPELWSGLDDPLPC